MTRVRRNDGIGHAQKALGDDPGDFETIEVLPFHFFEDSMQCVQDLLSPESAKEHHFDFCRHEEEVPSRGMNLAIQGDTI